MKNNEQLINNIIGQLNGVKKMMKEDKDCTEVLVQLKASKSGIKALMNRLIEEHSSNCLQGLKKKDKEKINSLFKEIIKNN
ncbi:MAG: metal-sensitive transcriptional regulator [Patescibacteria group bacterium]